jgi:hypothetical protein
VRSVDEAVEGVDGVVAGGGRVVGVDDVEGDVELEFMPLLRQVEHLPLVFDDVVG